MYGASDRNGAYPVDGRVEARDLIATIFHCLGIAPDADEVLAPPGSRRIYSNTGFEVAAEHVARTRTSSEAAAMVGKEAVKEAMNEALAVEPAE